MVSQGRSRSIVCDEDTIVHKKSLEVLEKTMHYFRNNQRWFGSLMILLAGNFWQTLSLIPRSRTPVELYACLKWSVLWKNVKKHKLTTNMRRMTNLNKRFSKQLLDFCSSKITVDFSTVCVKFSVAFCQLSEYWCRRIKFSDSKWNCSGIGDVQIGWFGYFPRWCFQLSNGVFKHAGINRVTSQHPTECRIDRDGCRDISLSLLEFLYYFFLWKNNILVLE